MSNVLIALPPSFSSTVLKFEQNNWLQKTNKIITCYSIIHGSTKILLQREVQTKFAQRLKYFY